MSELLSMLVPLDTLPGWPEATAPSALQSIGLLIGIPALVFVVIALLAKAPSLIKAGQPTVVNVSEPLWLGAGSEQARELTDGGALREPGQVAEVGGASVRW